MGGKVITGNEKPSELIQYDKKILKSKNILEFLGESITYNQSGNNIYLGDFKLNIDGEVNKIVTKINPSEFIEITSDNFCIFVKDSLPIKVENSTTTELFIAQHLFFTKGSIKITNNNTDIVEIIYLSYKIKIID